MPTPRNFTVVEPDRTERVYRGFDKKFDPVDLEHIVLVSIDGELEVFAVENPKRVSGLIEYLADRFSGSDERNPKIIGCYKRAP